MSETIRVQFHQHFIFKFYALLKVCEDFLVKLNGIFLCQTLCASAFVLYAKGFLEIDPRNIKLNPSTSLITILNFRLSMFLFQPFHCSQINISTSIGQCQWKSSCLSTRHTSFLLPPRQYRWRHRYPWRHYPWWIFSVAQCQWTTQQLQLSRSFWQRPARANS